MRFPIRVPLLGIPCYHIGWGLGCRGLNEIMRGQEVFQRGLGGYLKDQQTFRDFLRVGIYHLRKGLGYRAD